MPISHDVFFCQDIIHDPGRGAPLAKIVFPNNMPNGHKNRLVRETMVAVEGLYTGQPIYCGVKGILNLNS